MMMKLSEYLKEAGMSQAAFAALVGVDKSIISRLSTEAMKPSLQLAFAIDRATGGKVPAASWVEDAA